MRIISRLFPFNPKRRKIGGIRRVRRRRSTFTSYKGRFYKILQVQLYYNFIKINKLKMLANSVRHKYTASQDFAALLDFRMYVFFYKLNFFSTLRKSHEFIRKFGINIDNILIKKPTYIIIINSMINIPMILKTKFIFFLKKKPTLIKFLFAVLPFILMINFKTLIFLILKRGANRIIIDKQNEFKKIKFTNANLIRSSVKFLKRR